ncbi:MAG: hypothetical protein Q9M30_08055, partial [Mariprofundaceae bacterium]|nr:hypothetical protein [Mariprofundaceae bacterium]
MRVSGAVSPGLESLSHIRHTGGMFNGENPAMDVAQCETAERVAYLYRNGLLPEVINSLVPAVMVLMFWSSQAHTVLIGWLLAIVLLILLRAVLLVAYRKYGASYAT